jgi:hypothetical protein
MLPYADTVLAALSFVISAVNLYFLVQIESNIRPLETARHKNGVAVQLLNALTHDELARRAQMIGKSLALPDKEGTWIDPQRKYAAYSKIMFWVRELAPKQEDGSVIFFVDKVGQAPAAHEVRVSRLRALHQYAEYFSLTLQPFRTSHLREILDDEFQDFGALEVYRVALRTLDHYSPEKAGQPLPYLRV